MLNISKLIMLNISTLIKENLGQFFIHTNSYRAPDIVRVVGWKESAVKDNTKIRYVYVEFVNIDGIYNKSFISYDKYGGEANISLKEIRESMSPITKPIKTDNKLRFVLENDLVMLTKGNSKLTDFEIYLPVKEEEKIRFCSY